MGFSLAPGFPDLSSQSANGVIPAKWVLPIIENNNASRIYPDIANMNIDTQEGDTFVMATVPHFTVGPRAIGGKINYEFPEFPKVELKIDQDATYAFYIEDIIAKQSNHDLMAASTKQAVLDANNYIDKIVLGGIYADAAAANVGAAAGAQSGSYNMGAAGAPVQFTPTGCLDYFSDAAGVLLEEEAPQEDWFFIITPKMKTILEKSDLRSASFSGDKSNEVLRNGKLPNKIANFNVYVNSHLPTVVDNGVACVRPIFGVKGCFHFASQFKTFNDVKDKDYSGVFINSTEYFGYKVTKGANLGVGLIRY